MPDLLKNLINPEFQTSSYPGREAILSKIAGSGHAAAPPMIKPQQAVRTGGRSSEGGFDSFIKMKEKEKEKKGIQNALGEIISKRDKTGEKFLSPTERLSIFNKYGVSQQTANYLNDTITAEQAKAEPKYRTATWIDPATGETRTGLKPESELKKEGGIVTKRPSTFATKKQKILDDISTGDRTVESLSTGERFNAGIKAIPKKASTLKPMENEKGEWNYHKFNTVSGRWEDTGKGAKAPKEKKPEHSLKEVTEFMEENTYFADKEGESDITVILPEFANAAKDMLSKSDVADEYEIVEIESEIPAKKPWFGVNTPAKKVKTYKLQKKAAKPSAQMRKAGETITDYLKRIGR